MMKKTHADRFSSADKRRAVTVVKCFICNQTFYSQPAFDTHMKQHSNKLSRNAPEQIQRKTMESFKVKSNMQVRGSTVRLKDQLSKTTTNINKELLKENKAGNTEKIQDPRDTEESQALRSSMLLIEQIEKLTKDEEQPEQIEPKPKQESFQKKKAIILEEEDLIKIILQDNTPTAEEVLGSKLSSAFLRGYQEQLQYLQDLEQIETELCQVKIQSMKENIITTIVEEIKEEHGRQQQTRQARTGNKNSCKLVENSSVGYCGECYSQIEYGEMCWELGCGHKYHEECWAEGDWCCG